MRISGRSVEQLRSRSPMDCALWKSFPADLLEIVLLYVPIPELCRLRVVCKRWAALTKEEEFKLKAKPQTGYLFRTPDVITPNDNECSWEIRDPSTQSLYVLSDTFLYDHLNEKIEIADNYQRSTLAADKGWLAVLWITGDGEDEAMFVCNPVTKSFKELPPLFSNSAAKYFNPAVALVVADDMLSYKLFVVQEYGIEDPARKRCFVYNSSVGEWRPFAHPPPTLTPCHILKVDTILYTIFRDMNENHVSLRTYAIYSYDTKTDQWTDLEVDPPGDCFIPQLVACSGDLFFIGYNDEEISISEIDAAGKQLNFVATMEDEKYHDMLPDYDSTYGGHWSPYIDCIGTGANLLAVGDDQGCIHFSSVTGDSVSYDLNEEEWFEVEGNGLAGHMDFEEERAGLFGNFIRLSSAPVPSKDSPKI